MANNEKTIYKDFTPMTRRWLIFGESQYLRIEITLSRTFTFSNTCGEISPKNTI